VRPGGVYPKYGAVDRDYYGPEYDGFQDIFTMSLYASLECGLIRQGRSRDSASTIPPFHLPDVRTMLPFFPPQASGILLWWRL
jgi:hypothetical protein